MASSGDGNPKAAGEGSSPSRQGDSPNRQRVVAGSQSPSSSRSQPPATPRPQVQYGASGSAGAASVGGGSSGGGSHGNVATGGELVNVGGYLVLQGGVGAGGALVDSPTRKRTREEAGEGSSAGGGSSARQLVVPPPVAAPAGSVVAGANEGGDGQNRTFRCSLCAKEYPTAKGLFGHMRSHPGRGWRGAYPPPVFSREEFGDLPGQGQGQHQGQAENMAVEEAAAAEPPVQGLDLNVEPVDEGDSGKAVWDRDLNKPPPADSE